MFVLIFRVHMRQFDDTLSKQTKSRKNSKKTVDVCQVDLHNTRHLLRSELVRLHSSVG